METVSLRAVSFTYPGAEKKALDGIDLRVDAGEFVVLCGGSGSGKTTLLRLLKPELRPHGTLRGGIRLFGEPGEDLPQRESAAKIGFLLQNTEYQTVTHTVRAELAFGLENLGLDDGLIRLRIAELTAYFALEPILDRAVATLSGGQKQLLCLASVCAMHPSLLLLDEPTAQLDPAAGVTLLETVHRLCRENGLTVILSEHRLEQAIPLADRLAALRDGKIIWDGPPRALTADDLNADPFLYHAVPAPMRLFTRLGGETPLPLTVAEGRAALERRLDGKTAVCEKAKPLPAREPAVEMKRVSFSYDGETLALRQMDLTVPTGVHFALLGANAAGKSTALGLLAGVLPMKSGKLRLFGTEIRKYDPQTLHGRTVALLPQKSEALFGGNSVEEDLLASLAPLKLSRAEALARIREAAAFWDLTDKLGTHPYDLSGGELQRAALAMALLQTPRLLLLDEPTKGLDALYKRTLAEKLRVLCDGGATVITVTHDTEFAAAHCDGAALLFDGSCAVQADVQTFFSQNYFYTTAANKLARSRLPDAVTEAQVIRACENTQS